MVDIASISLRVDTTDLRRGQTELKNLERTGAGAERNIKRATDGMGNGFMTLRRTIGVVGSALAAVGAAKLAREAIQYSDAWKQVNNQLRQVSRSETELQAVRQNLITISRETNTELDSTVSLYSTLTRSTKEMGISSQEVADVTKTVNNLFMASGASAQEAGNAIRQLSQGLSAGALRGDEFNAVAENAPRIMDAIAEKLKMTRGELREFAAQGGITSKILVESLQDYREEAQRMADQTDRTFGQHMVNANTNMTEFVGGLEGVNGAVSELGKEIEEFTKLLSDNSKEINQFLNEIIVFAKSAKLIINEITEQGQDDPWYMKPITMGPGGMLYRYFGFGGKNEFDESKDDIISGLEAIKKEAGSREIEAQMLQNGDAALVWMDAQDNLSDAASGTNKAIKEFTFTAKDLSDTVGDEVIKELDSLYDRVGKITDRLDPFGAAVRRMNQEMRDFADAGKSADDRIALMDDHIGELLEEMGMVPPEAEKTADGMATAYERGIERMRDHFGDFMYDLLDKGKVTFDGFLDLFKRMVAEITATKILVSIGLGGGSSSALASGGGGMGGLSSIASFLTSNPLQSLGAGLKDWGWTSLGDSVGNMSAMDMGLSALAGYAGNFIGSSVGKALFGKEAESAWGATIGGTAGAIIGGPLGAGIGAAIGGLIDTAFGGDGKKRVQLGVDTGDYGWDGYAVGDTVTAASGLKLTARNLRAGSENDAVATALRDELALIDASLVNLFKSVTGEIVDFTGDVIGKGTEVKKGENQFKGFFGADGFNGLDPEEITAASEQFVRQWVDAANAELNASLDIDSFIALQRAGEPLYQTLARVTEQLPLVNQALEMLGMTALAFSADGMKAADGLISAFGGMENMAGAMQAYQAVAYTEAERLAEMQTALATTFEQLGVVMPENIAGLRQVIEGLDVTTASGQEAFATLIQLAPIFNQVAEASAAAAQAQAEAERQIAVDAANEQLSLLEETIKAEKSRITEIHNARMDQLDAERAAILQSVADARANIDTVFAAFQRGIDQRKQSITATAEAEIAAINSQRDGIIANYDDIAERINGSLDTVRESVEQLRRDADLLRSALGRIVSDNPAITLARQQAGVSAIRSGVTGDALERALTAATSATANLFGSRVDYERAQGRAGTAIAGRLAPADAALSKEEGILASLESQLSAAAAARDIELSLLDEQVQAVIDHRDKAIAGLDQQLELAQAQINAIDGTANNVATLTDVTSAIATYEQAQEMSIFQIEAIDRARLEQEKQFLRQTEYLDLQLEHNTALLENAIVQEANLRAIWGATNSVSSNINSLRNAIMMAINPDDAGYATGGIASGPTSGYTATLHGTEAIIPLGRGDIPVVVKGGDNEAVATEIRALRTEVSDLKTELRQIRTNTGDSASYQRKWEYRGMPATRDDVA